MIYLGIDVAKSSHVAAALTSEGEVALEPFSIVGLLRNLLYLPARRAGRQIYFTR